MRKLLLAIGATTLLLGFGASAQANGGHEVTIVECTFDGRNKAFKVKAISSTVHSVLYYNQIGDSCAQVLANLVNHYWEPKAQSSGSGSIAVYSFVRNI